MNAMAFVAKYESILESFRPYVTAEMNDSITEMVNDVDPHDLISPYAGFASMNSAVGFIWSTLVDRHNASRSQNATRTAT